MYKNWGKVEKGRHTKYCVCSKEESTKGNEAKTRHVVKGHKEKMPKARHAHCASSTMQHINFVVFWGETGCRANQIGAIQERVLKGFSGAKSLSGI
jgi:hypothetical protein